MSPLLTEVLLSIVFNEHVTIVQQQAVKTSKVMTG
jgi:hypothetical protein